MTEHRSAEQWETDQPGACVTVELVGVFALSDDKFTVRAPGQPEQTVKGFKEARVLAHALPEQEGGVK
jgi:hypothetical protein